MKFCNASIEKAAFGAKTTPQISRHRRETAAFSGFCKPEARPGWSFLQTGGSARMVFSANRGIGLHDFFYGLERCFLTAYSILRARP
ncbi:MAG: hypothetical protein HFG26_08580 [Provencibacterium sp.]|jgi:hypothetical protein|nr:hypothetical protein [Provencibacterium sp.]